MRQEQRKKLRPLSKAVENATMEIPDAMVDTPGSEHDWKISPEECRAQGLSLEQYFQFTGMDAKKMHRADETGSSETYSEQPGS